MSDDTPRKRNRTPRHRHAHRTGDHRARHRVILDAAMGLIAERGLHGASLRELARRVRLSQPSLYHYFSSKQEMVQQILQSRVDELLDVSPNDLDPTDLRGLVRFMLQRLVETYQRPEHPAFVRFLFAITLTRPDMRVLTRTLFLDRGFARAQEILEPFVAAGAFPREDAPHFVRLVVNAISLKLIDEHVLFGLDAPAEDTDAFVDFVVDVVTRGMEARRAAQAHPIPEEVPS